MPRAAHDVALLNAGKIAQQDNAHVILIQIHDHAAQVALELQHLAGHHVRQTRHTADTVGHADDLAHLIVVYGAVGGSDDLPHVLQNGLTVLAAVIRITNQTLQTVKGRAVIHGVAHAQAHAGHQTFVHLAAQVDQLTGRNVLPRFLAGGGEDRRQLLPQRCKLCLRQRLGGGNGHRQLFPLGQGEKVAGLGGNRMVHILNEIVHQRLAPEGVLVFLQRLAGRLRHLTENLCADLLLHDGAKLLLTHSGALAQHVGRLLAALGSGNAVFLHLAAGAGQQLVFPLLRLCLVLAYAVFKSSGVLLRSLRLVQRCGDLIPALLKHPRDHLAGDEKQGAEEDDEVDDGK